MAPHHDELTVRSFAPMPPGYTFVPKGDVYITSHCRKQTQAADEAVFTVINAKNATIGIRVPAAIYASVRACHSATRDQRAQAVRKRDTKLEAEFRDAVLQRFPRTPAASLSQVVGRATRKGSKRVGRTGTLDVGEKAELAVRAHIRHAHTDYDRLMRGGTSREKAREETYAKIDEVARLWGGKPSTHKGRRSKRRRSSKTKKRARNEPAAAAARGNPKAKGNNARNEKKTAVLKSTSHARREKKQTVRRTRATAASKEQSPEATVRLSRPRSGGALGDSLRDDGDSESAECEWSSLDECSDDGDDDDDDDDYDYYDDDDSDYVFGE